LSEVSSWPSGGGIVDLVFGDSMFALSSQGKQPCGEDLVFARPHFPHTHSRQF